MQPQHRQQEWEEEEEEEEYDEEDQEEEEEEEEEEEHGFIPEATRAADSRSALHLQAHNLAPPLCSGAGSAEKLPVERGEQGHEEESDVEEHRFENADIQ